MGTNYYWMRNVCPTCKRSEDVHIGKSSLGWYFALHVYPDSENPPLKSLDDWIQAWREEGSFIKDEYGTPISPHDMLLIISERAYEQNWKETRKTIPFGYTSWIDFHQKNYSTEGINGLLCCAIDGRHCIGHGPGTWDLCTGDFS